MVRVLDGGTSLFRLRVGDDELPLPVGEFVIGRGLSCDIVLDDSQVSRHHARLEVADGKVVIEDLDSINGSFLNEKRLRRRQVLAPGDRMRFGSSVLELVSGAEPVEPRVRDPAEEVGRPVGLALGESDIPTRRVEGLELGVAGAKWALAAGQSHRAERFLEGYLASVLSELDAGRPLPDRTVLEAFKLGLHLADKTGKGAWFDYGIRLLWAQAALPPPEQLAQMSELAGRLAVDIALLRNYEARMGQVEPRDAKHRDSLGRLREICERLATRGRPPGGGC